MLSINAKAKFTIQKIPKSTREREKKHPKPNEVDGMVIWERVVCSLALFALFLLSFYQLIFIETRIAWMLSTLSNKVFFSLCIAVCTHFLFSSWSDFLSERRALLWWCSLKQKYCCISSVPIALSLSHIFSFSHFWFLAKMTCSEHWFIALWVFLRRLIHFSYSQCEFHSNFIRNKVISTTVKLKMNTLSV